MDSIIFGFEQVIRFAFKNHNEGIDKEIDSRLRLLENEMRKESPNISDKKINKAKINYLDNLYDYIDKEKEKYENVVARDNRAIITFLAFAIIMVSIVVYTFPFEDLIIDLREHYPEDILYITASILAYIGFGIMIYILFKLINKKYFDDYSLKIDCLLDLNQVILRYKSRLETDYLIEELEIQEDKEVKIENSVVENIVIKK